MQELVDTHQASHYLGVAPSTIKKYTANGKLSVVEKRGCKNYFNIEELQTVKSTLIKKHKQKKPFDLSRSGSRTFNEEESQVVNLWRIHEKDTSSADVQIGLLSIKIEQYAEDLKRCYRDVDQYKSIRLMLLQAVGERRKKLDYLRNTDVTRYVKARKRLKEDKKRNGQEHEIICIRNPSQL